VPRRRWIAGAAVALGLSSAAGAMSTAQPSAPLFTRSIGPMAVEGTAEGCAGCHEDVARQWAASAHARSWTDPVFQAEYAQAPDPFCRECHAPRSTSARVDGPAADGIDCLVCHQREGTLLGRSGRGAEHHAVRAEPRLGDSSFCAPCHDFAFPEARPGAPRPEYLPSAPLQATAAEHARSAASDRTCQDCHMPRVGGRVDHRFGALSDPAMMRRAVRTRVRATAEPGGSLRVDVRLSPGQIGHAFPTGDMFRQGRFEVRRGADVEVERLQRWFARVPHEGAFYLAQVDDTRVPPDGARAFSLTLPPGEGPARYRLDLWRLEPATARRRGLEERIVRIPVASGRITPR